MYALIVDSTTTITHLFSIGEAYVEDAFERAATDNFPSIQTAVSYMAALVYHLDVDDLLHLIVKYGRKIMKVSKSTSILVMCFFSLS